jgi:hypothetical protein
LQQQRKAKEERTPHIAGFLSQQKRALLPITHSEGRKTVQVAMVLAGKEVTENKG